MPPSIKAKTHKGVKKRFKVTATGKVTHKPSGSSHLNSHKSGKRIRKLRRKAVLQNKAVSHRLRRSLRARHPRPEGEMTIQVIEQIVEADASTESATNA